MSEERDQPVADEPIVDSTVEGVADEANAQGDDQQLDEDGNPLPDQADDDSEEIDHEGTKYRVPKALKEAFLRQADYTRKTQEIAETRRTVETRQAETAQQAELVTALREDVGKVHALDTQVKAYEALDWGTLRANDPDSARVYYDQYREAKDALRDAKDDLTAKEQTLSQQHRQAADKYAEETWNTLAKDIKGWGVETARQTVNWAAKELGVRPEELRQADARTWKALHRAQSAEAELAGLKSKQAKVDRTEKVQAVTPAKTVGGKASGYQPGLSDNLPINEWVRRRNAEIARKRASA